MENWTFCLSSPMVSISAISLAGKAFQRIYPFYILGRFVFSVICEGEADVTITNLRYCHYSRSGNDSTVLPIGNATLQTAGKGSYEQLLASDVCAEDIKALKVYVQQAGNELLERIADGMSGAIGADSKTNEADW